MNDCKECGAKGKEPCVNSIGQVVRGFHDGRLKQWTKPEITGLARPTSFPGEPFIIKLELSNKLLADHVGPMHPIRLAIQAALTSQLYERTQHDALERSKAGCSKSCGATGSDAANGDPVVSVAALPDTSYRCITPTR